MTGVDPRAGVEWLSAGLLLVALVLAPVAFGAVVPWAWCAALVAVLLALALLVGVEWGAGVVTVPWAPAVTWGLVALIAVTLQLVPLPSALLGLVSPGARALTEGAGGWQAASLDRSSTLEALLLGVLYLGAGLGAARVAREPGRARAVLLVLLGLCAFQAFYGLVEQVAGEGRILFWSKPVDVVKSRASGTYVNPNHFAGFLAMGVPVALALAATAPGGRDVLPRERGQALLLMLTDPDFPKRVLLAFAGVITAAGLAGSFSRGGLLAAVAGCVGVVVVVARTSPGRLRRAIGLAALAGVGVVIGSIALEAFVDRFRSLAETTEPGIPGRLQYNLDTLRMIGAYPVLGVGAGAFEVAFPRFDSAPARSFVNHAHDDYVQLLVELGVVPALALLYGLFATARGAWRAARTAGGERQALALTALVALVPVAVHALVDFNLRIPANALWAAALLGTAWGVAHPTGGARRLPLPGHVVARGAVGLGLSVAAASLAAAAFLLATADWEARPEVARSRPDDRPLPVRVASLERAVELWPYEARLWGELATVRWQAARADELEGARAAARELAPNASDETAQQLVLMILQARLQSSEELAASADRAEAEARRAIELAPGDSRWPEVLRQVEGERPRQGT